MTTATARTIDRPALLALCERALGVPEDSWHNRDTSSAARQLGEAYALLRSGCEFFASRDDRLNTWWVTITYRGFSYFEGTYDGMGELDDERFYIPTAERLDQVNGGDWY